MAEDSKGGRTAIVIGGGLAGMLAVTALAGHVDVVTVVERDRYPDGQTFRKGVPQARHLHILLSGGQRALEELLPGTVAALCEAGARSLYLPRDLLTRSATGWQRRFDERRHLTLSVTRPVLDTVVREQVLRAAAASATRVEVLEATEAIGLTGDAGRVSGVRVRSRGGDAGGRSERELPATVVVDASGRGSRTPQWYAALGRTAPQEETVDAGLAYATRMYRPKDPATAPDAGVNVPGWPGCPRGAAYVPVEDGKWLLTVSGVRGHHPPTDEAEFTAFTATIGDPYVHELLAQAEPLSPVHGFRDTCNRRRHYERPGALPEGFLVLGDAGCTFNPVYGQGMSVAALGALAVRTTLADGGGLRPGTTAEAQRAVARAVEPAWLAAVGSDRPYASPDDAKAGLGERLSTWYIDRLFARAAIDPVVGAAFRDVFCLTAPPARLVAPQIFLRTVFLPRRPGLPSPPAVIERV
ncbi:NAD(P)/FAD-dependent oxidoreductase [Streptomyces decoyicus]|uniref:NAD(P)/FAD-dependent oxidoreductase n=1 Tax=Streptomyces decoyicus TaxID=249567 RepID=UPI00069DEBC6|nr:FAD-dependent oxidoreductase [Streptomyces decoyicus]KOG40982.1 hydroxylase [Streptomyces decoyicus]QZY19119.1 FAD-binding protein [Streptomyces decoyicus]